MPSNKILTILIICFGIVTSIYLFRRKSDEAIAQDNLVPKQNIDVLSVSQIENNGSNKNSDWKKILVNLGAIKTTSILTNPNPGTFDGTTLTAQMSRDFMSQYLLLKKGGKILTAGDMNAITSNVLSSSQYTEIKGPLYVALNLHINLKEDLDSVKKYRDAVNLILKTRSMEVGQSPVTTINKAVKAGGQDAFLRLETTISIGKNLINDLLQIEVPQSAVSVHLGLLNASSDTITDLEAIRVTFTDPVRGLAGMGQYNKHIVDFQNALADINKYFVQKTGSSQ